MRVSPPPSLQSEQMSKQVSKLPTRTVPSAFSSGSVSDDGSSPFRVDDMEACRIMEELLLRSPRSPLVIGTSISSSPPPPPSSSPTAMISLHLQAEDNVTVRG